MKRCISFLEKNEQQLIKKIKKITAKITELIEIRLDCLKNPNLKKILANSGVPVIISTRSDKNWNCYFEALKLKVAYIDVDLGAAKEFLKKLRNQKGTTKLIISYHNYQMTPSEIELKHILKKIWNVSADIAKIAVQTNAKKDNLLLLKILMKEAGKKKIIIHGMGEKGKPGRLLAALLGSEISYLASNANNKTAPGQWTVQKWNELIEEIMA